MIIGDGLDFYQFPSLLKFKIGIIFFILFFFFLDPSTSLRINFKKQKVNPPAGGRRRWSRPARAPAAPGPCWRFRRRVSQARSAHRKTRGSPAAPPCGTTPASAATSMPSAAIRRPPNSPPGSLMSLCEKMRAALEPLAEAAPGFAACLARGRKIQRFNEAVAATCGQGLQRLEVQRCSVRGDLGRQCRGVGRHHQLIRGRAAQCQPGHPGPGGPPGGRGRGRNLPDRRLRRRARFFTSRARGS